MYVVSVIVMTVAMASEDSDMQPLGTPPPSSHYSSIGEELVEPEVVQSSGGVLSVTLPFERWTYQGPNGPVNIRVYAGRLPGPTLRFKRGDIVNIRLENKLPSGCEDSRGAMNMVRDPCITNLHTHGLHIGSTMPGDDVFIEVEPGASYNHTYEIPENHLGGTHWYHPHHHGSTSLQVVGGAGGMLIVEDDASDLLPVAYANMPEKLIVMTVMDSDLTALEAAAGGNWATTQPSGGLLLNGQTSPKMSMDANQWVRLRMVNTAVQDTISITIPNGCEAMLLAKDGVWLPGGSRATSQLHFAPGNRVDAALRCSSGEHKVWTDGAAGRRLQGGFGGGIQAFPTREIMTIVASDAGLPKHDLPGLTVAFPSYMPDLQNVQPANTMSNIRLQGGRGCQFTCGAFNPNVVTEFITLGETHVWNVNAVAHPLHVHINHIQLKTVDQDPFGNGWHQPGDWVDTFLGSGSVHFLADSFTGDVIAHCHLLIHEDQGCMARFHILEDASQFQGETCVPYAVANHTFVSAARIRLKGAFWTAAVAAFSAVTFASATW